jgi:peptide/nickel transport system substrate-binding protein
MDQGRAELRSSEVRGRNPFQDQRVRRALYQAIDIEVIRREIMRGLARPAAILVPPGMTGYTEELNQRLPYDPEAARRLIIEAGYPDGFGLTLDCPNNRYINDEAICRAVAAQLGQIGLKIRVDAQPMTRHLNKIYNRETDLYLLGYAAEEPEEYLIQLYHSRGSNLNPTGYSNPRADALIDAVYSEVMSYVHDAQLEEVLRLVRDDIVYLPLHYQVIVWAMRAELDLPIFPFNYPQFRYARFTHLPAQTR